MVQQTAEQESCSELLADLESDTPPPEILPIVTTGELTAWLKHPDQALQPHEMPNRNELKGSDLPAWRAGSQPRVLKTPSKRAPSRAVASTGWSKPGVTKTVATIWKA